MTKKVNKNYTIRADDELFDGDTVQVSVGLYQRSSVFNRIEDEIKKQLSEDLSKFTFTVDHATHEIFLKTIE